MSGPPASGPDAVGPAIWPGFIGAALLLYWPVLSVGFLSDDFGLIARADHWMLGATTPSLFRPGVMLTWAVMRALGSGPLVVHLWGIVLHGTAAFLVARLALAWNATRPASLAGLIGMAGAPSADFFRRLAAGAVTVIVVMSVWATRVQLRAWTDAASLRDAIVTELRASSAVQSCAAIGLADYPDNVRGAFVFRNSLREALEMSGLPALTPTPPPGCGFRWDPATEKLQSAIGR